jgi:hypothetical protein
MMGSSQKMSGWKLPSIIDLGEIGEKVSVTIPLVVDVPGPTQLTPQLSNMQLIIDRLPPGGDKYKIPGAGESLVYIRFQQGELHKDTMIAGQILLECQGETREVWIVGQVISEKDYRTKSRQEMILLSQSGVKYNFSATNVIGREQFKQERGAEKLGDNQAFIVRDPADVWSVIQTKQQNLDIKINGIPLLCSHRHVLSAGDVIEIGELRFTVESKEKKSSLKLDSQVNFGKLSGCRTTGTRLHIQNVGKANWEGRIRSTLPWIRVPAEPIICSYNQSIEIPLQLSPQAASLQQDTYIEYGALVLSGTQESWLINARLEVDITGPSVEIEPHRIELGRVYDPASTKSQVIIIRNSGAVDWDGSIRSTVDWLLVEPGMVTVKGNSEAQIIVSASPAITRWPEGFYKQEKAIVIEGGNCQEIIAASIDIERPKAMIEVDVAELAFGKVSDWHAALVSFYLNNKGTKEWRGNVTAEADWVDILDEYDQHVGEINLGIQNQLKLKVRLKESFHTLPIGKHKFDKIIHIFGSDKVDIYRPVSLTIEAARIEADPAMLSFVVRKDSHTWEQVFWLWNRGGLDWTGRIISSVPWLSVDDQTITIQSGRKKPFTARIDPKKAGEAFPENKPSHLDNVIRISEGIRMIGGISVSIIIAESIIDEPKEIPPPPPKPPKRPAIIELGKVTDWAKPPVRLLPVANNKDQPMKVSVSSRLSWLEIQPKEFEIIPNGKTHITLSLKEEAAQLQNGLYNEPDAFLIQTPGTRLTVTLQLEVDVPIKPIAIEQPAIIDEISLGESPEDVVKAKPKPEIAQAAEENKKSPTDQPEYVIDFGEVTSWSPSMINRSFRLNNSTNQPLEGVARCELSWLTITPEQFRIEPGNMLDLKVELTQIAGEKSQIFDEKGAVVIQYGGLVLPIRVKAKISRLFHPAPPGKSKIPTGEKVAKAATADQAEIAPTPVDQVNRIEENSIPQENKVEKNQIQVEQENQAEAKIILPNQQNESVPPDYSAKPEPIQPSPGAIVSEGEPSFLIKLVSGPESDTQLNVLNFGQLIAGTNEQVNRSIILINDSATESLQCSMSAEVSWLEVNPTQFSLSPGEKIEVKVSLATRVQSMKARVTPYHAEDAVCINAGEQQFYLPANLTIVSAT